MVSHDSHALNLIIWGASYAVYNPLSCLVVHWKKYWISCTQKLLVNLQESSYFMYISYHRKLISTFLWHFQIQYRAQFPVPFLHTGQVTFLWAFLLHRLDGISCTFTAHRKCGVNYKYPMYEMHRRGEISCTFPVYRINRGLVHLT